MTFHTMIIEGETLTGQQVADYDAGYKAWKAARGASLPFVVGETYLRYDGVPVKCVERGRYECVRFDDGGPPVIVPGLEKLGPQTSGWRYDRDEDRGRCTASRYDNPRNVVPRPARGK